MGSCHCASRGLTWRPRSDRRGADGRSAAPLPDEALPRDGAPDSALVRLAQAGSHAACEALIQRYQDRVYTVVNGYLRDPEEALDVTQEVFVRMVEGLPRFREQSNFYTWLYR